MRQLCADGGGPGPAMEVPPGSEWHMKALGTSQRSPSARPGPTTAHGMGGSGLTAGGRCREKGRFYDPQGASQEGGRRVGLGAGAAKGALPRTTVSTTAGTGRAGRTGKPVSQSQLGWPKSPSSCRILHTCHQSWRRWPGGSEAPSLASTSEPGHEGQEDDLRVRTDDALRAEMDTAGHGVRLCRSLLGMAGPRSS